MLNEGAAADAFNTVDGVISIRVTEGLPKAGLFYEDRGAISCCWEADWARDTLEHMDYFELDAAL
jgi:hypothetical protein